MRIQIKADAATPGQVFYLTRAYQRSGPNVGDPSVRVTGDTMDWESPLLPREQAATVLREFDRLEAGLFDAGTADRDPNTTAPGTLVFPTDFGKRAGEFNTNPVALPVMTFDDPSDPVPTLVPTRKFEDGAAVRSTKGGVKYIVLDGEPDEHGRIWIHGANLSPKSKTLVKQHHLYPDPSDTDTDGLGQFNAEGSAYVEGEDPIGGDEHVTTHYTSENDDGTWTVYRETYTDATLNEAIDGSTVRLRTYSTEAEADAAADHFGRLAPKE